MVVDLLPARAGAGVVGGQRGFRRPGLPALWHRPGGGRRHRPGVLYLGREVRLAHAVGGRGGSQSAPARLIGTDRSVKTKKRGESRAFFVDSRSGKELRQGE